MVIANVAVEHSSARTVSCEPLPIGASGLKVRFQFQTPIWAGLTKTAVFRNRHTAMDAVLSDNCATIPHELLTRVTDTLYVGIYGTDSHQALAIPTVWTKLGEVSGAAIPCGSKSQEQTLPYWAQVMEQVDAAQQEMLHQEDIESVLLQAKNSGDFDGPPGVPGEKGDPGRDGKNGADGKTPVRGVDYWTAADIAEIKAFVDEAILGGAW